MSEFSLGNKVGNYIGSNSEIRAISQKALSPNEPQTKSYAQKIANSTVAQKSLGDKAVFAYGEFDGTEHYVTLTDPKTGELTNCGLVDSPYEYYFTDMVFIQQKYEEVILDLLFLKFEDTFLYKIGNIDDLIEKTFRIAEQNGVKLSKEQLLDQFAMKLDKHVALVEQNLLEKVSTYFPNTTNEIKLIAQATKRCYLNPNNETYNKLQDSFVCLQTAIKSGPDIYTKVLGKKVNLKDIMNINILASLAESQSGLFLPYF